MYPRGSNNSTADYSLLQSSFKNSNNYISTRDAEYASSSTQLPLLEDHDGVILSYLLSQQHFLMVDDTAQVGASVDQNEISVAAAADAAPEQAVTMEEEIPKSKKKKKKAAAAPRKRCSGKKDRHSKICTAQGPRDRRMRLSLQIARKFFDLQDMLGFDKASKTIDWLFTKSRSAIQELKQHLTSSSPNCSITRNFGAAAESVKYSCSTNTDQGNDVASKTMEMRHSDQKKSMRNLCMVAKGSRDEARARARERTREKMRIRSSSGATSQDREANRDANLGFCLGEELAENPTYHHLFEQGGLNSMMSTDLHQKSTSLMIDGSTSSDYSRSIPIANYKEAGEFPGFSSGNWGNANMQPFRNMVTASMIKPFTGKNVLQVENPSSSSNSQEQNYSPADTSIFMTPKTITQEASLNGCCSINFITSQDQDQNPNPMFSTTLLSQHYQNSRQFL